MPKFCQNKCETIYVHQTFSRTLYPGDCVCWPVTRRPWIIWESCQVYHYIEKPYKTTGSQNLRLFNVSYPYPSYVFFWFKPLFPISSQPVWKIHVSFIMCFLLYTLISLLKCPSLWKFQMTFLRVGIDISWNQIFNSNVFIKYVKGSGVHK